MSDELIEQGARVIYGVTNPPEQRRPWPSPVDAEAVAVLRAEREYYLRFARALADAGMLQHPTPPKPAMHDLATAEPACVLTEANDMEAFAALPECPACEGTGKQMPEGFWSGTPTALELANEGVAIAAVLGTGPPFGADVQRCPEHGLTHAEHELPPTSSGASS